MSSQDLTNNDHHLSEEEEDQQQQEGAAASSQEIAESQHSTPGGGAKKNDVTIFTKTPTSATGESRKKKRKHAAAEDGGGEKKGRNLLEETTKLLRKNLRKLGREKHMDRLTLQQLLDEVDEAALFGNDDSSHDDDGVETPSATNSSSGEEEEEEEEEEERNKNVGCEGGEGRNNDATTVASTTFTSASGRSVVVNAEATPEATMTDAVFNNLVAQQLEERKTTPWAHLKENYLYRVDHVQRFESMYGPCWVGTLLPIKPGGGGGKQKKKKNVKMPRVFLPKGFVWKIKQNYMPGKACYFKTLGFEAVPLVGGQGGVGNRKR